MWGTVCWESFSSEVPLVRERIHILGPWADSRTAGLLTRTYTVRSWPFSSIQFPAWHVYNFWLICLALGIQTQLLASFWRTPACSTTSCLDFQWRCRSSCLPDQNWGSFHMKSCVNLCCILSGAWLECQEEEGHGAGTLWGQALVVVRSPCPWTVWLEQKLGRKFWLRRTFTGVHWSLICVYASYQMFHLYSWRGTDEVMEGWTG